MRIPLALKVASLRAAARFPAPLGLAWSIPVMAIQMVTYRDHHPVQLYRDIEELSQNLAKVRWTEDPWNGDLDVVKHPTFFQEAIEKHPDYADDCDGFAAYACVAILKAGLASEVYFATAYWANEATQTIDGHAVCVYRDNSGWHWIGNWQAGKPYHCVRNGWVSPMESITKKPIIVAAMWPARRDARDTLILEPARFLRR